MAEGKHTHHTIDYIEFSVTNMEASKTFYSKAFDWEFNDYGPEYAGIKKPDGGESGGFRLDSKVIPGGPLVVLYSQQIEKSFEAVKQAGGSILKDIFEFPGGRRFEFADPNGNQLAVWSPK